MRFFSVLLLSCSIAANKSGRWSTLSEEQKQELKAKIKKHHEHKQLIEPCIQELYQLKHTESLQRAKRSWVQLCVWNKGFFDDCDKKQGMKKNVCEHRGPHAFELVDKLKALEASKCLSLLSQEGVCERKRRPRQKVFSITQPENENHNDNSQNSGQHGPGRLGRFGLKG